MKRRFNHRIEPNTRRDHLLRLLQQMKEAELITTVIRPLLGCMGFRKIEEHGGPGEHGRDLICFRQDEWDDPSVTVVQVKRVRLTGRSSDKESLSEIVNQLSEAAESDVAFADGTTRTPDERYFITPYPLKQRSIEARIRGLRHLSERNIKIIDGDKLYEAIETRLPSLLTELAGPAYAITMGLAAQLNNAALMKALKCDSVKDLRVIHTDIDFCLGRPRARRLLLSAINTDAPQQEVRLGPKEWSSLTRTADALLNKLGIQVIVESSADVEAAFQASKMEYDKWQKQMAAIDLKLTKLNLARHSNTRAVSDRQLERAQVDYAQGREPGADRPAKERNMREAALLEKQKSVLGFKEPPTYDCRADCTRLVEALQHHRSTLVSAIATCNRRKPSDNEVRELLQLSSRSLHQFGDALGDSVIASILGIDRSVGEVAADPGDIFRVNIPVERVLDTRINIVLLGDAGAGKTTTLQKYAAEREQSDRLHVFLPLAEVVGHIAQQANPDSDHGTILEHAIATFLATRGISSACIGYLWAQARKGSIILLLDGVDEAIGKYPAICMAIREFAARYCHSQIVVSSRMLGISLDQLPFPVITLLPFTKPQKKAFICKWFSADEPRRTGVLAHVSSHPELADVISSPLNATVLCALAEKGVALPATEVQLFRSRFRLLLGAFDDARGVWRVKSDRDHLERLARGLAYHLHKQRVRSASIASIEEYAIRLLRSRLPEDDCLLCAQELIVPCNLLLPMTEAGGYGFGHLRYQEFLAAEELNTNRHAPIKPLIGDMWWKDCLLLYARVADDMESLVANFGRSGGKKNQWRMLEMMAHERPAVERDGLLHLIQQWRRHGD